MQNYDGQEMIIRLTNKGKFQALPAVSPDMTRAPVFATQQEAEAYIGRPMPQWIATERAKSIAQEPYVEPFLAILSRPELREMRRNIQKLYGYACERDRLGAAAQRAAIRGFGQVSCIGRDIGAARQGVADEYGDESDQAWAAYWKAERAYRLAKHTAMREAGIPVTMFETPELF